MSADYDQVVAAFATYRRALEKFSAARGIALEHAIVMSATDTLAADIPATGKVPCVLINARRIKR